MRITVPATSANMGPGFDSLGIALKMYNVVDITPSRFFSVSVKGEGEKMLKARSGNIFLSIFSKKYEEITGFRKQFRFRFDNQIPLSRGLGSSSAVIVSALFAANVMAKKTVNKTALLREAFVYERHPDNITPATFGGFCVTAIEEQEIRFVRARLNENLRAVIVMPDKTISTRQSRKALPKRVSMEDAVFNLSRSSLLVASLMSGNFDNLKAASRDRFHQDIRMRFLPPLFDVQKCALDNGALMSVLSGSGSSFFNMALDEESAIVIENALKRSFPQWKVRRVEFDTEGVRADF
ncbi:MAG: homoserine kinase [Helicobacteraceae bacterium]|jgi:homoserine kinase|nr:homoserine kinase [Helicobacteraceae bacterium]